MCSQRSVTTKICNPGRIPEAAEPGPELDREQLYWDPFTGTLNEVVSPQLSQQPLIGAGALQHGEQLRLGDENMLTHKVREQDAGRVETMEAQREQLPAARRHTGRLPG